MSYTEYTYKVRVDHYITFTDEDVRMDAGNGKHAEITDEQRATFAQYKYGTSLESDFDTVSVDEYETNEVDG